MKQAQNLPRSQQPAPLSTLIQWGRRFPVRIALSLKLIHQMLVLAWKAHALLLVVLLALQIFEGLIPLVTAFISKSLFDHLALMLHGVALSALLQGLVILFLAQAAFSITRQLASPLREYL